MSFPEPQPLDDDGAPAPHESERPEWLVGADEGAAAEKSRSGSDAPPAPALRLVRPGAAVPEGTPASRNAPPAKPARPVAWTAAASSIPRLAVGPAAPDPLPVRRAEREIESEDSNTSPDVNAFPDDASVPAGRSAPPPALSALHEPWWILAMEELRSSRRAQVLTAGAVLVVLAALIFWPRGEPGVSISNIRHHSARFDGARVRVSGRVGEVYQVGGGYAFYLVQGRDTMVVFTRVRVPVSRQNVTLVASVSTGFLDGIPRQALFEETP